jgi:hypothetical protein
VFGRKRLRQTQRDIARTLKDANVGATLDDFSAELLRQLGGWNVRANPDVRLRRHRERGRMEVGGGGTTQGVRELHVEGGESIEKLVGSSGPDTQPRDFLRHRSLFRSPQVQESTGIGEKPRFVRRFSVSFQSAELREAREEPADHSSRETSRLSELRQGDGIFAGP